MKAIILEDEPRAAKRLQRMISEAAPAIEIVDTFESVQEAQQASAYWDSLDLIFSDIQLSDGLSFDLFETMPAQCPVIFTTAYDQYAIKAFKNRGIDYLLKPIEPEELRIAISKVEEQRPKAPDLEGLLQLAQQLDRGQPRHRERFMVRVGQKLRSIPTQEILGFYSENKATYLLHKGGRSYPLDTTLDRLQEQISQQDYFRVNRAYLLRAEAIIDMVIWSNSRLKLKVEPLAEHEIIVARDRTKEFKTWMGEG